MEVKIMPCLPGNTPPTADQRPMINLESAGMNDRNQCNNFPRSFYRGVDKPNLVLYQRIGLVCEACAVGAC